MTVERIRPSKGGSFLFCFPEWLAGPGRSNSPPTRTAGIFRHTSIQMDGYRTLEQGQRVEFEITQSDRGPQADLVRSL
ncbi:cold shock domain-containing protein [Actinocorallia aurantiaca]|uniref:CSD domain-containing protein n=1 Tax=Actinocorallia aurantiaca TaxID=46204 RepID=A0ABN3TZ46_9ACTN